jgi:hypothetical protein
MATRLTFVLEVGGTDVQIADSIRMEQLPFRSLSEDKLRAVEQAAVEWMRHAGMPFTNIFIVNFEAVR